jgi:hypothetical protein
MIRIFSILACIALLGCEPSVPDGRIRVKNDSQDATYNVVKVVAGGSSYTLKPGESTLLKKGTTSLSFSRAYRDYERRYHVTCPAKLEKGISIKLIDVHLNRIAGGCVMDYANMK